MKDKCWESAFDELCSKYDLDGNEWQDMGCDEIFRQGYVAALKSVRQPMETAPKDGTDIIALGGTYGCEYTLEFHNARLKHAAPVYYDTENQQWQFSSDAYNDYPCYVLPKYWMPFPEILDEE